MRSLLRRRVRGRAFWPIAFVLVLLAAACQVTPATALDTVSGAAFGAQAAKQTRQTPPRVLHNVYITGYSWWDNTPPGSADIAYPRSAGYNTRHNRAGGTGTYDDPITLAVGWQDIGGKAKPDFYVGTRFYLPYLKKYVIVEDLCGDRPRPQDKPCHSLKTAPKGATAWIDVWVGKGRSRADADRVMREITGLRRVIIRPPRGLPVVPGDIASTAARPVPSQSPSPPPRPSPSPSPTTTALAAAERYGWGAPKQAAEFTAATDLSEWELYDSAGHAGNGRRSPGAISVSNGVLRITGTPDGTTGGMAWRYTQIYGRWEARVKLPPGDAAYHPVLILWPSQAGGVVAADGELDYLEVFDAARQQANLFLHPSAGRQLSAHRSLDMTTWHTYAVEVAPDHVTAYIDGQPWFHTSDQAVIPRMTKSQTIQLDWFPSDGQARGSTMEVDWVRMYGL